MALFGILCGMVVGALSAILGLATVGFPLWVGLLVYSGVGTVTALFTIMILSMRDGFDLFEDTPATEEAFTRRAPSTHERRKRAA